MRRNPFRLGDSRQTGRFLVFAIRSRSGIRRSGGNIPVQRQNDPFVNPVTSDRLVVEQLLLDGILPVRSASAAAVAQPSCGASAVSAQAPAGISATASGTSPAVAAGISFSACLSPAAADPTSQEDFSCALSDGASGPGRPAVGTEASPCTAACGSETPQAGTGSESRIVSYSPLSFSSTKSRSRAPAGPAALQLFIRARRRSTSSISFCTSIDIPSNSHQSGFRTAAEARCPLAARPSYPPAAEIYEQNFFKVRIYTGLIQIPGDGPFGPLRSRISAEKPRESKKQPFDTKNTRKNCILYPNCILLENKSTVPAHSERPEFL